MVAASESSDYCNAVGSEPGGGGTISAVGLLPDTKSRFSANSCVPSLVAIDSDGRVLSIAVALGWGSLEGAIISILTSLVPPQKWKKVCGAGSWKVRIRTRTRTRTSFIGGSTIRVGKTRMLVHHPTSESCVHNWRIPFHFSTIYLRYLLP